ncbi:hypothetical protein BDZ91DRAFT_187833 [Kalaharituber pfeilii]|nr:hypothetical protein BDZ91DRAFT_187833 [Kalaharituber pfeilii]
MSIFCCTSPRSYSPRGVLEPSVRSLSFIHAHRKIKWTGPGRRHSRQDIEAFYQEGKRLKQEEDSHDEDVKQPHTLSFHPAFGEYKDDGRTALQNPEPLSNITTSDAHIFFETGAQSRNSVSVNLNQLLPNSDYIFSAVQDDVRANDTAKVGRSATSIASRRGFISLRLTIEKGVVPIESLNGGEFLGTASKLTVSVLGSPNTLTANMHMSTANKATQPPPSDMERIILEPTAKCERALQGIVGGGVGMDISANIDLSNPKGIEMGTLEQKDVPAPRLHNVLCV